MRDGVPLRQVEQITGGAHEGRTTTLQRTQTARSLSSRKPRINQPGPSVPLSFALVRAPTNPYNPIKTQPCWRPMSGDFRRPPPPPPPPLEDWLLRRDRADGYREPFFAGREAEFGAFQEAAQGLEKGFIGGETLVFQGAPGAGKSALMQECAAAVKAHSTLDDTWVAVAILPSVLEYPAGTAEEISLAVERERERLAAAQSRRDGTLEKARQRTRGTIQGVKERGGGILGVRVGARAARERIDVRAAFRQIENVCRGTRVVLFMDEAQILPEGAKAVLDALHRGQAGIALLPVLFGLGDTAAVLAKRGISRPPSKRLVELSALRLEEARESLLMVFDAYGVHGRTREEWLHALAGDVPGMAATPQPSWRRRLRGSAQVRHERRCRPPCRGPCRRRCRKDGSLPGQAARDSRSAQRNVQAGRVAVG